MIEGEVVQYCQCLACEDRGNIGAVFMAAFGIFVVGTLVGGWMEKKHRAWMTRHE